MTLDEIVSALKSLSLEEKQDLLIETSARFEDVPAAVATRPFNKNHRVPGCESEVYVWSRGGSESTLPKFYFAVENPQGISARALAVILDESFSNQPRSFINSLSAEVVYEIFGQGITMGRGQGLMGMINMIKSLSKSSFSSKSDADSRTS